MPSGHSGSTTSSSASHLQPAVSRSSSDSHRNSSSSSTPRAASPRTAVPVVAPNQAVKACAYCALVGCPDCVEGSLMNPPRSCHLPEHGRSVCSACANSNRLLTLPADRALLVMQQHSAAFQAAFSVSVLTEKKQTKDRSRQPASSSAQLSLMGTSAESNCFSPFYSHLHGNARCFDIFDAADRTIWEHVLPYSQVFMFPTADDAERLRSAFPQYLQRLPPSDETISLRMWYECGLIFDF